MKLLKAFPIIALVALVALSGCLQPPVCGNGICETGESQTCPTDCEINLCETGTYEEGDMTEDFGGAGLYSGQEVALSIDSISKESEGYSATIHLMETIGTQIDYQTLPAATMLNDFFVDSDGNSALNADVNITQIGVESTTSRGFVVLHFCDRGNCATGRFYEGETLSGLEGRNMYAGQNLVVRVDAIVQSGAAATRYNARFILEEEPEAIDTRRVWEGQYLNELFLDHEGNNALKTKVQVTGIGINGNTSKGFVDLKICR